MVCEYVVNGWKACAYARTCFFMHVCAGVCVCRGADQHICMCVHTDAARHPEGEEMLLRWIMLIVCKLGSREKNRPGQARFQESPLPRFLSDQGYFVLDGVFTCQGNDQENHRGKR